MEIIAAAAAYALLVCGLSQAEPSAPAQPAAGGCPAVTSIRFYPRAGQASRMLNGRFTASNEGATTGFETIAEIKEIPKDGEWTELKLLKPVRYRFLKYEAPPNSWGNVAEIEFLSGAQKIQGQPFGTTGSRANGGNDFSKALDGRVETFFDGAEGDNQYVGIDLGPAAQAAPPDFSPKPGRYAESQMLAATSATPGVSIRLARGGGTPDREHGELYTGPVKLDKSGVIAAIAYGDELAASPVVVAAYRIGQGAADSRLVRTFHTGNSLTDTVDGWLKPMAESAGRPLDFHRFTVPGAPTEWLWTHPGSGFGDSRYAEAFFAFAPIDHLITQPFAGHGRSVENETFYSGHFFELCRQSSPEVSLWLYQQWPEQKFGESWSRGALPLGKDAVYWKSKVTLKTGEVFADGGWAGFQVKKSAGPATWQEAVANHSRYFEILRDEMQRHYPQKPIGIIPGGPALATLKDEIEAGKVPGLKDFFAEMFADGIHLTSKGRYLIALVHYACLFKENPVGKVSPLNSGLTDEQAVIFQRIAWDTVRLTTLTP
jgi:hypothetical protein